MIRNGKTKQSGKSRRGEDKYAETEVINNK